MTTLQDLNTAALCRLSLGFAQVANMHMAERPGERLGLQLKMLIAEQRYRLRRMPYSQFRRARRA